MNDELKKIISHAEKKEKVAIMKNCLWMMDASLGHSGGSEDWCKVWVGVLSAFSKEDLATLCTATAEKITTSASQLLADHKPLTVKTEEPGNCSGAVSACAAPASFSFQSVLEFVDEEVMAEFEGDALSARLGLQVNMTVLKSMAKKLEALVHDVAFLSP
eukprot:7918725-Alexandrium_andersonii.AAC.1